MEAAAEALKTLVGIVQNALNDKELDKHARQTLQLTVIAMQETENLLEVAKKRIKEGRKEDDREVLPTKFKTLERILANYRESLAKYAHRIEGPDPNASHASRFGTHLKHAATHVGHAVSGVSGIDVQAVKEMHDKLVAENKVLSGLLCDKSDG